jgi:hypothetical protein
MLHYTLPLHLAFSTSFVLPALAAPGKNWDYTRRLDFTWFTGEPCPDVVETGLGSYSDDSGVHSNVESIQAMLSQCPTFKTLSVQDSFDKNYFSTGESSLFEFQETGGLPAVHTIRIRSWDSFRSRYRSFWERLEPYREALNTDSVRTLDFDGPVPLEVFIEGTEPAFPNLDTLVLTHGRADLDRAVGLLFSMPTSITGADPTFGLKNLTWAEGWDPLVLEPLLNRHGATLESLQLRGLDEYYTMEDFQHFTLSAVQLDAIAQKTPRLKHLEVGLNKTCDMEVDDCDWPVDELAAIISSRSLESLHLHLESEAFASDNYGADGNDLVSEASYRETKRKPYLTLQSAFEAFIWMIVANDALDGSLKRVNFEVAGADCQRNWASPRIRRSLVGSECAIECAAYNPDGTERQKKEEICKVTKAGPTQAWQTYADEDYDDGDDDYYEDYEYWSTYGQDAEDIPESLSDSFSDQSVLE